MKRRDLLKTMAVSLPALAVLSSKGLFAGRLARASASGIRVLNVIFEGPFVFFVNAGEVRVMAPRVERHLHRIADGAAAEGAAYSLQGIRGSGATDYDLPVGGDAFCLSAMQWHLSLNRQKNPFFSVVLPAPERVVALTASEAEIVDASGTERSVLMPTSYAFVYSVQDPESVRLTPATEWDAVAGVVDGRFANLLVATGLALGAQDPDGRHARAAFAEATSYFAGLHMQILSTGAERQVGETDGLPDLIRNHRFASNSNNRPKLRSAVLSDREPRPRLMRTSSVEDCRIGGVIVN